MTALVAVIHAFGIIALPWAAFVDPRDEREDDEEGARRALREDDEREAQPHPLPPGHQRRPASPATHSTVMTALVAVIHAFGIALPWAAFVDPRDEREDDEEGARRERRGTRCCWPTAACFPGGQPNLVAETASRRKRDGGGQAAPEAKKIRWIVGR